MTPCCARCGYDLRGHEGEVRRCPECGEVNVLSVLGAQRCAKRQRQLQFWAIVATASAVASLLSGLTLGIGGGCCIWPASLCGVAAALAVFRFRRLSMSCVGWRRTLARHLANGAGFMLCLAPLVGGGVLASMIAAGSIGVAPLVWFPLLIALLALLAIWAVDRTIKRAERLWIDLYDLACAAESRADAAR